MKEEAVQLGKSDLWLPAPLAIGTLQWGTTWVDEKILAGGRIHDDTAVAIYAKLVESGLVGLVDTAEGYGGGTSEQRIAHCATQMEQSGKESDLHRLPIVATKFLPTLWRWTEGAFERALRGSLKRLELKSMDVYFLHSPIHPLPIEFWVQAAAVCMKKGLMKTLGLSNCNSEQVTRFVAAGKKHGVVISCNQVMFSLLDFGSAELQKTVETCKALGVTIIAYSPIGQGLLTDKLTQESFKSNRPAKMFRLSWEQLTPLRSALKDIAGKHGGKSMAQVAINWCVCHGTVPLVGCRSVKQADDTLGSMGWRLDAEEVALLDTLALHRSTLDSPKPRRALFVTLAGVLMVVYKISITINHFFGSGSVRY